MGTIDLLVDGRPVTVGLRGTWAARSGPTRLTPEELTLAGMRRDRPVVGGVDAHGREGAMSAQVCSIWLWRAGERPVAHLRQRHGARTEAGRA